MPNFTLQPSYFPSEQMFPQLVCVTRTEDYTTRNKTNDFRRSQSKAIQIRVDDDHQ